MQMGNASKGGRAGLWVWGLAAGLLAVPAVAMRFTDEVNWTASDFAVAALLLAVPCAAWQLVVRSQRSRAYRAGVAVAVLGAALLAWINLAVGVIGSEHNPANLLLMGVLLLGAIAAALVRFQAAGMVLAMLAMALAQFGVGLYAVISHGLDEAVWLCGFFTVVWLLASGLFARAARQVTAA